MKSPWYENWPNGLPLYPEDEEESYFINQSEKAPHVHVRHESNRHVIIPWTLAAVFGIIALVQFLFSSVPQAFSYTKGFETEFEDGFPHISLVQKRFTTGIHAYDNGTFYIAYDKSQPIYAAPPSPEIDRAWAELEGLRYINLTDSEVSHLNEDSHTPSMKPFPEGFKVEHHGKSYDIGGGYYSNIAMLHQIHCLNMIRRRMDRQYYGDHDGQPPEIRRMHLDHCLDNIRQAILCHGDMTPITMRPVRRPGGGVIIAGDTERMRTCRNSDQIIEYVKQRGEQYMHRSD